MVERDKSLSWIEDEAFFRQMCDRGKKYEALVAQKLGEHGITGVQLLDDGFRKNISEIGKFTASSKDLKIKGWSFEVKSRNVAFTSPEDWPVNFWPMFLDTVSGFEKKVIKPIGYIFISQQTGALMGASCRNRESWEIQRRFDRERKIYDNFYCLQKKDVIDEAALIEKLKAMPEKKQ